MVKSYLVGRHPGSDLMYIEAVTCIDSTYYGICSRYNGQPLVNMETGSAKFYEPHEALFMFQPNQ